MSEVPTTDFQALLENLEHLVSVENYEENQILSLLKQILWLLRGPRQDSLSKEKAAIAYFSYRCQCVSDEIFDRVFELTSKHPSLVQKYKKTLSKIITQLVIYNFPRFIEKHVDSFIKSQNEHIRQLGLEIYTNILDPVTGFLLAAPLPEGIKRDFFDPESEALQTPFGIALVALRRILISESIRLISERDAHLKIIPDSSFIPISFLSLVQTVVVPPGFKPSDACGFPSSTEVLFAVSAFQKKHQFTKSDKKVPTDKTFIWDEYFLSQTDITSSPSPPIITIVQPSNQVSEFISVLKTLSLTASSMSQKDSLYLSQIMIESLMEGNYQLAAFVSILIQIIPFPCPDFAFPLIDVTHSLLGRLATLNHSQQHTLLATLARFCDTLSCLQFRYLDDTQVANLDEVGLLGICSPCAIVRTASLRLLRAVSHFETETRPTAFLILFTKCLPPDPFPDMFPDHDFSLPSLSLLETLNAPSSATWLALLGKIATAAAQTLPAEPMALFTNNALQHARTLISQKKTLDALYTLTFLTALAHFPLNLFPTRSDEVTREVSFNILQEALAVAEEPSLKLQSRLMLANLHISAFPSFLSMSREIVNPATFSLSLAQMALHPHFPAISEHDEFSADYLDSILSLAEMLKPFFYTTPTTKPSMPPADSIQTLSDFLIAASAAFKNISNRRLHIDQTPFPCRGFVATGSIADLEHLFPTLFSLSFVPEGKSLQKNAVSALSAYFACTPTKDLRFAYSDTFAFAAKGLAAQEPDILLNLLTSHFELFFPRFLELSLNPSGEPYFVAICRFFHSPSPAADESLEAKLKAQWRSCGPCIPSTPAAGMLQIAYESLGTLVIACLEQLSTSLADEAFITLGSILPCIFLYHNLPAGKIKSVIRSFLTLSRAHGRTISGIGERDLVSLSEVIANAAGFCLEQTLSDGLTSGDGKTLEVLKPWFSRVSLNPEERIVSVETDRRFRRFSIFAFIEKLTQTLPLYPSVGKGIFRLIGNEEQVSLLATAILAVGRSNRARPMAVKAIELLLSAFPSKTLDYLVSRLSLAANWKVNPIPEGSAGFDFGTEGDEETVEGDDAELAAEALVSLSPGLITIEALPIIFAHAIVTDRESLLKQGLKTAETRTMDRATVREIAAVSRSEGRTAKAAQIARVLASLDPAAPGNFSLELLRWGLTSRDLNTAAAGLEGYAGIPLHASPLLVALAARALWRVTDAALSAGRDASGYVSQMMKTLVEVGEAIASTGSLSGDSALFWVATEGMKAGSAADEALGLLEVFLSRPGLFSVLAGKSKFDGSQFTAAGFWKFHKPWGDTFSGTLDLLLNHVGQVPRVIQGINRVVQAECFPLAGEGEWPKVALLALLPWMWSVVTRDMSTFRVDSVDVPVMAETIEILRTQINDEEISGFLEEVMTNPDADTHDLLREICRRTIDFLDIKELGKVSGFFGNCLRHGGKELKIPLYAVATEMILRKPEVIGYLEDFISLTREDTKPSRKAYVGLFLAGLSNNDSEFIEPQLEPSGSNGSLEMFERIVAVNIPHLYELGPDDGFVTFDDMNSFPPLIPNFPELYEDDKFKPLVEGLRQLRCEPFSSYDETLGKLHMSMVEDGAIEPETGKYVDIPTLLKECVLGSNDIEEEVKVDEEISEIEEQMPDPFMFIPIEPDAFVPSVDDVNMVGMELLDSDQMEYDGLSYE